MAKTKPNSKRKTRSDKFPLTLHPTGQYCKKIKGKLYYFGADKQQALQRYLEQATYLHSGKMTKPTSVNNMSLKILCNLYLDHQESRSAIGEIKPRQVYDQTFTKPASSKRPRARSLQCRAMVATGRSELLKCQASIATTVR